MPLLKFSTLLLASVAFFSCNNSTSQQPHPDSAKPVQPPLTSARPLPGDPSMDSTGAVSWLRRPGNNWLLKGKNNEIFLYINLRGNNVVKENKRVPLNISLVLDRSGSMSGDKIAYAKRAAAFVIEQLSAEDLVSVVNYDDQVEVTSASQPIKNKEALIKKINALYDRGSTNLTGGMLEGYTQTLATKKDGFVNRVLLLTDGLANQGITDPATMKKLVETKYTRDGIALSTFGLGADYNEDLLTQLAEVGRANYYFIDSPDKIPGIFASELKGLLTVVAQNAWVSVQVPPNLELVNVYGYPAEINNNSLTIRFSDIYANDEKGILVKLRSKAPIKESINIGCTLQYTEAAGFTAIKDKRDLVFELTTDNAQLEKGKDTLVEEMVAVFEATALFDDILAKVDKGEYEQAKLQADSALSYLKTKQTYLRSDKLKKQEVNLEVYSKEIDKVKGMREEEKKMHQKSNKAVNYRSKKGKY